MPPNDSIIESAISPILNILLGKADLRNEEYYDTELDKLEQYAEEVLLRLYDELKEKEMEIAEAKKRKQKSLSFEERKKARAVVHRLELAYSNLSDKVIHKKKRLFEEKDKEMKKLGKKLNTKVQKTCIARAWWVME